MHPESAIAGDNKVAAGEPANPLGPNACLQEGYLNGARGHFGNEQCKVFVGQVRNV
jgi:hypothetical protein